MRRRRVTGRFYIFLTIVAVIAFLAVRPLIFSGPRETDIMMANSAYTQKLDCVIIRDEAVTMSDSTARVEYIARENSLIQEGDTVVNLYTTGYSESLLSNLETTRQNIQAYHKELLANILDSDLERLDGVVNTMALEFKNLITHQTAGNLETVSAQLETAMVNRQEYLRRNKREDTKLTKLYEEENTRLSSIQSWRKVSTAEKSGVVSFYLDGYESDLSADDIETLSIADVRTVLNGGKLANTQKTMSEGIYRIVDQDDWYVAILANAEEWTPVVGQSYFLQMEGYDDLSYTATVTSVLKESGNVLAVFKVDDPMGSLIYKRTGKAQFSITLTGLSVDSKALYDQQGQIGVWLYDVPGGTFVPVEVLHDDGDIAMIQPLVDGVLQLGQKVLIK